MKKRLSTAVGLALACAAAALVVAPAAGAEIRVGVADDHAKTSPAVAEQFYAAMNDVGLTENRITLLWDSHAPTTIRERDQIAHAVAVATAHGVHVTISIYPDRARAITESPGAVGEFAAFTALVARTFPQVKDFIVGNEPNKARFWQPQFNENGSAAACAAYETLLAAPTTRSRPSIRRSRSSASAWARGGRTSRSTRATSRSPPCAASATSASPIARPSGGARSWTS